MELGISDKDSEALEMSPAVKDRIVGLVHNYIGCASAVSIEIVEEPAGVRLETGLGTIVVDRTLTNRIDT